MRKIIALLSFVLVFCGMAFAAEARTHRCELPEKPSITDYFNVAVPYIHTQEELIKCASAVINGYGAANELIEDKRNGYIYVKLGANEDVRQVETCYWRTTNDAGHNCALLAVYGVSYEDVFIRFFVIDRQDKTVTEVELPFELPQQWKAGGYDVQYKLPRTGKTIEAWTYGAVTEDFEPQRANLNFTGRYFETVPVNFTDAPAAAPVAAAGSPTSSISQAAGQWKCINDGDVKYELYPEKRDGRWGWLTTCHNGILNTLDEHEILDVTDFETTEDGYRYMIRTQCSRKINTYATFLVTYYQPDNILTLELRSKEIGDEDDYCCFGGNTTEGTWIFTKMD